MSAENTIGKRRHAAWALAAAHVLASMLLVMSTPARADILLEYEGPPPAPGSSLGPVRATIRLVDGALGRNDFFGDNSYLPEGQKLVVGATLSDGRTTIDYKNPQHRFEIAVYTDAKGQVVRWQLMGGTQSQPELITVLGPGATKTGIGSRLPEGKTCPGLDVLRDGGRLQVLCGLGRWTSGTAPAPTTPHEPSKCPGYSDMVSSAEEISKLAENIRTDDRFFQEVVVDILLHGYDSPLALLGMVLPEQLFVIALADSELSRTRADIVQRLSAKARTRLAIGTFGANPKAGVSNPRGIPVTEPPPVSKEVLAYFCNFEPDKLTSAGWDALYGAGYIDVATYGERLWSNFVDAAFHTAVETVITTAAIEVVPLQLWARYPLLFPSRTKLALGAIQAVRLNSLLKAAAAKERLTPIGRMFGSVPAAQLNAAEEALKRYAPWATNSLVRELEVTTPRRLVRLYAEGATKMEGRWMTLSLAKDMEGLTAEQLKQRFSLSELPTHMVDVIVNNGARMRVGWASEVPLLGTAGGGRQVQVLSAKGKLQFVNPRPIP